VDINKVLRKAGEDLAAGRALAGAHSKTGR
jgi:hypothetical protein